MPEKPSDVALLVVSCDRYADLWRPYFHCLFKYWPDCPYPVYLGSNAKSYSDPRVTTLAIGDDRDYSSNLLAMLDRIPQEWVIATVEDRFISGSVDSERLDTAIRAVQAAGGGYLKLIGDSPVSFDPSSNPDVGEIPRGVCYRVSFTVALWKKSVLRSLLKPGESAWDIERQGTRRSYALPEGFYAVTAERRKTPLIANFHSVVKGLWVHSAPGFLRREGLDDCLAARGFLPLHKEIYGALYHWRLAFLISLRRHWKMS